MAVDIKEEYITEKDGKSVVLFAGLLDAINDENVCVLISMDASISSMPSEKNEYYAVVKATVSADFELDTYSEQDPKYVRRTVSASAGGYGSDLPNGFEPGALVALVETRAYARALRLILGVTMVSFEELPSDREVRRLSGPSNNSPKVLERKPAFERPTMAKPFTLDDDDVPPAFIDDSKVIQPVNKSVVSAGRFTNQNSNVTHRPNGAATPAQIKAIYGVGRGEAMMSLEEIDSYCGGFYGVKPEELTVRQASEFIDALRVKGK